MSGGRDPELARLSQALAQSRAVSLAAYPTYTRKIEFAQEALIHALVAAPIPVVIAWAAARLLRGRVRDVILGLSVLLFVALFYASYFFFCVGCT